METTKNPRLVSNKLDKVIKILVICIYALTENPGNFCEQRPQQSSWYCLKLRTMAYKGGIIQPLVILFKLLSFLTVLKLLV